MESTKEIVATGNAPQAIGPYSQAVKRSGLVFCSGQIPLDSSTGQVVAGGIAEQTACAIENLKAVLDASGAGLDSVLKTTVFVKDLAEFGAMNEVYAKYFGVGAPARSTVEVARLPKDVKVEIEAIAFVK